MTAEEGMFMRKFVLFLVCMILFGVVCPRVFSQFQRRLTQEEQMLLEAARRQAESERRMAELERRRNSIGKMPVKADDTPSLDKDTIERIRAFRQIDPAEQAKYAKFLTDDRTGMLRFYPDNDCVTPNYVRIDGDCAGFVPNSYGFSFRAKSYTDDYYHDIAFKGDEVVSTGFFSQGVLVALGDVQINKVDAASPGLKYLVDLQPDLNPADARQTAVKFSFGVNSDGYRYARRVKTSENTTYAARVVAYRIGNGLRPLGETTTTMEKRFISLSFDTRADIIVVFRIVKLEKSGPVTILWKELSRGDAPKIKFGKGEPLGDIKP